MDEPRSNAVEYTVSEIAQAVRRTVEDNFGYVRVRGEISGYRGPHSSGHAYFSLKDADVAAVVSYIRQAWGNHAGPVLERDVGKYRQTPID